MGVHYDSILVIDFKSCHVAHKVGRELRSKPSSVLEAPQKLCRLSILSDPDYPQVVLRIRLDVLKLLACSCNKEALADERLRLKTHGDFSYDAIKIQILR